jgi:molybdopterin synthase sulfur carrier subunit
MQVTVKLFATLTHYGQGTRAGTPITVELPEKASLYDLISILKIPSEETRIMFVNGIIQESEYKLKDGDEVGIFPPIGGGGMVDIHVNVWLYGDLARYGGQAIHGSYANPIIKLPENGTIRDLLAKLKIRTEERGITFINGNMIAKLNVQPDLDYPLKNDDRVAFFDLHGRWMFQAMV